MATVFAVTALAATAVLLLIAADDDRDALVRAAVEAPRQGDYATASARFEEAARRFPADLELHYNLGVSALAGGALERAERAFRTVLAARPEHASARLNLGKLLCETGRAKEGVTHLERAVASAKADDEMPRLELAVARVQLDELERARKDLAPLTRSPQALGLLAFLDLRQARFADAVTHADAALALASGNLRLRLLALTARLFTAQRASARASLEQLSTDAPRTLANVPYALALGAFLDGDPVDARRWMAEAQSRAPEIGRAHV